MASFVDRFVDVRRVYQQQARLREQELLVVQARIAQLSRQREECQAAIQAMTLRDVSQATAEQALLVTGANFRQKIHTLYQTTRVQIAELESERDQRRQVLQALRVRIEQLDLYRARAWASWRLQQRRSLDAEQKDAIARGIFWPGDQGSANQD